MTEFVQPIVLLVDRENPAAEVDGIAAVAAASVAAYRARNAAETTWDAWLAGAFTKSVRRADGKTFAKIINDPDLDPVIVEAGTAVAAAFAPVDAAAMPKALARLQVSGTTLPSDPSSNESSGPRIPTIWLNQDLGMSTGKAAAQAAHAALAWQIANPHRPGTVPVITFRTEHILNEVAEEWDATIIRDAGRTEIAPNSMTAVAFA